MTFDKSDARSLLADERVFFAHGPTNRSIKNMLRNLRRRVAGRCATCARRSCSRPARASPSRSRGSRRLRGAQVVYVESLARIDGPSLTYRLISPIAARRYVQWPELAEALPGARFAGNVFSAGA